MTTAAASPASRWSLVNVATLTLVCAGIILLATLAPAAHSASGPAGAVAQLPGTAGCTSNTGSGGACIVGEALDYAHGVALSPDGDHVYVASYYDDAVVVYARDSLTGELAQTSCVHNTGAGTCTDATALNGAWDIKVSPDGEHVLVTTIVDDSIVVFDRNDASGALTQRSCISRTGHGGACIGDALLDDVRGVEVSPDGKHVYAASAVADATLAYILLPATGSLVRVGCHSRTGSGGVCVAADGLDNPRGIAVSPGGETIYIASYNSDAVSALSRDAVTGVLTHVGCVSETGGGSCVDGFALNGARSVEVSPDAKHVYVVSSISDALVEFERDATTGLLAHNDCVSETGTGGLCTNGVAIDSPTGVTASPDGGYVYVGAITSDAVSTFARSTTGGSLNPVACISRTGTGGACAAGTALDGAWGVAMSPDGRHLYSTSYNSDAVTSFDREFAPTCLDIDATTVPAATTDLALACTDADGDALTAALLSDPLNGSLTGFDPVAMTIAYTPAAGFRGIDAFGFSATDGTNTSIATARITVVQAAPSGDPAPGFAPSVEPVAQGATSGGAIVPTPRISVAVLPRTRGGGRTVRVRISCKSGPGYCAGRLILKNDMSKPGGKDTAETAGTTRRRLARRAFFIKVGTRQTINLRMRKRNARVLFELGGNTRLIAFVRNKQGGQRRYVRSRTLLMPKIFAAEPADGLTAPRS